jgi:hypothetical protein
LLVDAAAIPATPVPKKEMLLQQVRTNFVTLFTVMMVVSSIVIIIYVIVLPNNAGSVKIRVSEIKT